MYYVTEYREYPIYEPAEGGYYYEGVEMIQSRTFQTFRKARKHMNRTYKDVVKNEMPYIEGCGQTFFSNENHLYFGAFGKYVGDRWFYVIERKQGREVRGATPYC